MRNHALRLFITLLLSTGLIYTPILRSAQLALPAGDLVAPEVSHPVMPNPLEAGASVQIKAAVTDNVGVKSVSLFFRTKGSEQYKRVAMHRAGESDEYAVTLGSDDLAIPGLEYYIQAMDLAGNSLLHGYSFSPLSVSVIAPLTSKATESNAANERPATEKTREEPVAEKKSSKTWLWITLGVVAVGAIAASSGSGGDTGTGTVVVTSPTP